MMTPAPIKNWKQAVKYYEETDDYYAEGGKALSGWYGNGAKELGLSGKVEGQVFQDVLRGVLPNGEILGRIRTNESNEKIIEHRPGVDAQFSAPKSVSVVALIGGDDRILEAHNNAVKTALSHYEKNYLVTRIRDGNGSLNYVKTGNLVAATFLHETSREQDAQLHTHSLIMNATLSADGKWRSIDDRTVFAVQKELGLVYKQSLSADMVKLGYEVVRTTNQGDFEIVGVPKEVRDEHSTRSNNIEAALAERGKTRATASSAEKRVISEMLRPAKQHLNHDDLKKQWHEEALSKGFDAKSFVKDAISRSQESGYQVGVRTDSVIAADNAVRFAGSKLSERDSVFTEKRLLEEATKEAIGKAGIEEIARAVQRANYLVPRETEAYNTATKTMERTGGFTTQKSQQIERSMLQSEMKGRGADDRLMDSVSATKTVQDAEAKSKALGFDWTSSQRNSTAGLLTNNDRVVAIQGYAGTAKTTTVLASYREALEARGYQVIGMAPSASAASTLRNSGGFDESKTVARHLIEQKKAGVEDKSKQFEGRNVDRWKSAQNLVDGSGGFVGRGGAYYMRDLDGKWQRTDTVTALVRDISVIVSRALGLGRKEAPSVQQKPVDTAQRWIDGNAGFVGRGGAYYMRDLDGKWQRADVVTSLVRDIGVLAARALGFGKKEEKTSEPKAQINEGKQVWVVDEASMLSAKDMNKLLSAAEQKGAKVVLVGDVKQLGSVEAGAAFRQLQEHGMTTFKLDEVVRQTNSQLKGAVYDAIEGKANEALAKLAKDGGVKQILGKSDERLAAMAKDYLSLSANDRAKTILIDPSREGREKLNNIVRDGLREEGVIRNTDTHTKVLIDKGLTKVERASAFSYEPGDVVRFGRDYEKHGVNKGDYFTVKQVDKESSRVVLEKPGGPTVIWEPKKWGAAKSEVYEAKDRAVAEGDQIRFTRNDGKMGVNNGTQATVTGVSNGEIQARTESGKEVSLSMGDDNHRHWDHSYAQTAHNAQGATADRVMYHAESWRVNLTNQQSFYVGISRAKEAALVYTDNAGQLIEGLQARAGQSDTALERNQTLKDVAHSLGYQVKGDEKGRFEVEGLRDAAGVNVEKSRESQQIAEQSQDQGMEMSR